MLESVRANLPSHSYRIDALTFSNGSPPEPAAGVRCFENELLWETSFAGLLGDDAAVSDGVGVWLWRDDGAAVTRDLLVEDAARSTFRVARIIGLSTAGDTLALLWKKDADGDKTVLSLFDLDRAALGVAGDARAASSATTSSASKTATPACSAVASARST